MFRQDMTGHNQIRPGWYVWDVWDGRRPLILDAEWDEWVSAVGGCVTQTCGWVEYALATDYPRALLIAGLAEEGEPRAVAVGFISEPRWPLRGFRTMHFPSYPSVRGDTAVLAEALSACEAAARAQGCMSIRFLGLGQPPSLPPPGLPGYTRAVKLEYVVDLTRGKEALWRAVSQDQQRNVKLSRSRNVYIVRTASPESVRILRALQSQVSQRHAARGDAFGLRPPEAYDALYRTLVRRSLARVYCALAGKTVVAAALITTFGRRARGIYNGSSQEGLQACAPTALIWHLIAQLSQEGFAELSFGTADPSVEDPHSPSHGLHRFKLELGARTQRLVASSRDMRPVAVRAFGALKRLRSYLSVRGRG